MSESVAGAFTGALVGSSQIQALHIKAEPQAACAASRQLSGLPPGAQTRITIASFLSLTVHWLEGATGSASALAPTNMKHIKLKYLKQCIIAITSSTTDMGFLSPYQLLIPVQDGY
jgi:hypothetical protein